MMRHLSPRYLAAMDALNRCVTQDELEDAWYENCDEYAEESRERSGLLNVFNQRLNAIREASRAADYLRAG